MTDTITISFVINKESNFAKELNKGKKLSEIRKLLTKKLLDDSLFTLSNGCEIEEENEDDYQLSEIIIDDKIYLKKILKKQNKPIPGSKLIEVKDGLEIYLYPKIDLTEEEKERAKVFMIVGEAGSGKTTFLNSFLNYNLGIHIEDNFRYKIIHEELGKSILESKTSDVNIYNIKETNGFPPIQIIDTTGFDCTEGISKEKLIFQNINKIFKEKINSLNAICLVAKSNTSRLTIKQQYIFSSILDLFGEDIKENFLAMITFSDGRKPLVIDVLESSENAFSSVIPYLKSPWYFTFNNSAIFESDRDGEYARTFFKLSMKNFKEFTQKLLKMTKKSLDQTKQVLDQRIKLEENAKLLYSKLTEDKMENIKGKFSNFNMECINIQNLIIKSINKLQKIALNKTSVETSEKNIEILIEIEKSEKRPGWQKRTEELVHLKIQKKFIREIYNGENQKMKDLKAFMGD